MFTGGSGQSGVGVSDKRGFLLRGDVDPSKTNTNLSYNTIFRAGQVLFF